MNSCASGDSFLDNTVTILQNAKLDQNYFNLEFAVNSFAVILNEGTFACRLDLRLYANSRF